MKICATLLFMIYTNMGQEEMCYPPSLNPKEFVGVIGLRYIYTCQGFIRNNNITVQWYLNNTLYFGNLSNVEIADTTGLSRLRITNSTLKLNNTEIICSAKYSDTNVCNSTKSLLILQGKLSKVSSLQAEVIQNCSYDADIVIQWMPPYTLNLTQVTNDINYNVEVIYNSKHILIQQMIASTTITSILPQDLKAINLTCGLFNVTVTPYNNVGLGDSTSIQKNLFSEANTTIEVIERHYLDKDDIFYILKTCPAICNVEISLIDCYHGESIKLKEDNIGVVTNCSENSYIHITTLNSGMKENRKYLATFNYTHTLGFSTNIISTYAIQDCILNDTLSLEVVLTIIYLENTEAMGALLAFFSNTSSPIVIALNILNSSNFTIPSYLASRTMLTYDIENNGLLTPGMNYPSTCRKIISDFKDEVEYTSPSLDACTVTSMETIIIVHCDCNRILTIIEYQVLLINTSDPSGKLYTSIGNCSAPANLRFNSSLGYYIVVFSIKQNKGITESEILYEGQFGTKTKTNITEYIIIGVVLIGTTICCIVLAVIVVHLRARCGRYSFSPECSFH